MQQGGIAILQTAHSAIYLALLESHSSDSSFQTGATAAYFWTNIAIIFVQLFVAYSGVSIQKSAKAAATAATISPGIELTKKEVRAFSVC